MRKILRNFIYKLALKVICKRIVRNGRKLTPEYLINKGFIEENGYYFEKGIKDRDLITIQFENQYYRVWHSEKRTFIALESTIEWFETYYILLHPDNGRYTILENMKNYKVN